MQCDILIIGGGPAGMVVASSARAYYPEKSIVVVKEAKKSAVPCAIPYVFGDKLDTPEDNFIPCGDMAQKQHIDLLIDEVEFVDKEKKIATLQKGEAISFDKLVFATGSIPKKIPNLNTDIQGVHFVSKDPDKIVALYEQLQNAKKVAIIGTGFIGVEVAGELAHQNKEVHLIGSRILKHAFDEEVSEIMEDLILHENISFYKGAHIEAIEESEGVVSAVVLESGERIACDTVIMATGYTPNNALAKKSGISMRGEFIYVNEYMKSATEDIFAVGDCAQKRDFITKNSVNVMLASTATAEARTCASSLYGIKYAKTFSGTIAIFSTVINDTCFASAGVTEYQARRSGLDIEVASFEVADKHPAKLPNANKQFIKMICMRRSGVVVGAQMIGGVDTGEMINIIGVVIENNMNIYSLINLQVATHPLLTSAPTMYPIAKVAQMLDIKINKDR